MIEAQSGPAALTAVGRRPGLAVVMIAVVAMAAAGAMLVALNAAHLGAGDAVLGLVVSTLPAPLLVGLVLALDRFEPEPRGILALTFLWGATVAALFATVVNTAGGDLVAGKFGSRAANVFVVSVSAPIVEEVLKGAALLVLYRVARRELNGIVDGIIYAGVVGLGFAVGENVHYYGSAAASGDVVLTIAVRGILSPFAHPLFSVPMGIGFAIAASPLGRGRMVPAALGLLASIVVHSAWNSTFLLTLPALVAVVLVVFVPAFFGVLVLVRRGLEREGELVRTQLLPEVGRTLTTEEVEALSSVRGRRALLRSVAARGPTVRRAARDLCHVASELAFHREQAASDARPDDSARDARLVARLEQNHRALALDQGGP